LQKLRKIRKAKRLGGTLAAAGKPAGIPYFGAGADLDEAEKPYYFAKNKHRVGVYALSEHSGCAATERSRARTRWTS
jgi:hypothetical protein